MRKIYLSSVVAVVLCAITASMGSAQNFTTALPIPDTLGGPTYNLTMAMGMHAFWDGSDSVETMAYNGMGFLGPTLMWYTGTAVQKNVTNNLDMETTNHWHGAHVPGYADGGPHEVIEIGETWDPSFTIMDASATMWYHPHLHHHTLTQVQMGLAGLIIVRDPSDVYYSQLPHTYGVDEFPLIVQDREVLYDSSMSMHMIDTTCTLGDTFLVNGRLQPYLNVPAQYVRFHILNGASERTWMLGIQDGDGTTLPFQLIATDAGYTAQPYTLDSVMMGSAERTEWAVDFTGMEGDTLYLVNIAGAIPATLPGGPDPSAVPSCYTNFHGGNMASWDSTTTQLMRIIVGAQTANPITTIPSTFGPLDTPDTLNTAVRRTKNLVFDGSNPGPPFLIDSLAYATNTLNDTIILGDVEIWSIRNVSTVGHPFHIHDVHFHILDITDISASGGGAVSQPAEYLQGPKDVVLMPDSTIIRFVTQFNDFSVKTYGTDSAYMYHCHILSHEDGGMMHQFNVMDTVGVVGKPEPYRGPVWGAFPNPTEGRIFLRGDCFKPSTVRIYNAQAQLIQELSLPVVRGTYELPTVDLPRGLLFVEWQRPEGTAARKVIVR